MRSPLALSALVATALPTPALACSVCFSATEENRFAFLLTTIFLSFLPLIAIGAGARWLWKREREIAALEASEPVA